jgi:hypothetical protein
MGKREEQRREADRMFEECRQAIARLSDAQLCETLLEVPHRKWIEIEKDTHMAIGIIAHRAAHRIAELTSGKPARPGNPCICIERLALQANPDCPIHGMETRECNCRALPDEAHSLSCPIHVMNRGS